MSFFDYFSVRYVGTAGTAQGSIGTFTDKGKFRFRLTPVFGVAKYQSTSGGHDTHHFFFSSFIYWTYLNWLNECYTDTHITWSCQHESAVSLSVTFVILPHGSQRLIGWEEKTVNMGSIEMHEIFKMGEGGVISFTIFVSRTIPKWILRNKTHLGWSFGNLGWDLNAWNIFWTFAGLSKKTKTKKKTKKKQKIRRKFIPPKGFFFFLLNLVMNCKREEKWKSSKKKKIPCQKNCAILYPSEHHKS